MSQEKVSVRALASPSRIPRLVKKWTSLGVAMTTRGLTDITWSKLFAVAKTTGSVAAAFIGAESLARCRFSTLLMTTQRPVVCVARPRFLNRRMPSWLRGYVCTASMYSSRVASVLTCTLCEYNKRLQYSTSDQSDELKKQFPVRVSVKFNCRCEFARFYL